MPTTSTPAKRTRKAKPIAAAAPAATTLTPPPAIGQHWPEQGGTYIGIASDLPGGATGHLVLLDDAPSKRIPWKDAKAWATALGNGARLPTRVEALLLFANVKSKLTPNYHWTCEEYSASYAWLCHFRSGSQDLIPKSYEGSAVAVRRLPLQSFNPLGGAA